MTDGGMTTGGWIMLGVAWTLVFALLGWSYWRTLTMPRFGGDDDDNETSDR